MSISKIDSGGITASGITADSLDIGQIGGRRNLIINGAMQVAQRGTSATTDGYATVDRFRSNYGGGTVTQSQESLSSGAPFELGFHKFFRTTNTSVVTDTAAHFRIIRQNIEDQNVATSGWNYKSSDSSITLSFWVRSSVAQEFYAYLLVAPPSYNYAFSLGTLSANTWTKVTKTIPGNSNLSFDNDNTIGIELNILPFFGTNFTASGSTTDAWFAFNGASRVPDMTSTWGTTSGATFDITGVQLEVGTVATPFEHRSYGEELQSCLRYFWQITGASGNKDNFAIGMCHNTTQLFAQVHFPVAMRIEPTTVAEFDLQAVVAATGYNVSFNSVSDMHEYGGRVTFNADSGTWTAGNAGIVRVSDSASSFISFDAEL